jgi:hypothetical protein
MTGRPTDSADIPARFLAHFWQTWPVTATFAGVQGFDAQLPDWSPDGLSDAAARWATLAADARHARGPHAVPALHTPAPSSREDADLLCIEAAAMLLTEETATRHGPGANPVYATGEIAFGLLSVLGRDPDSSAASATDAAADAAARLLGASELLAGIRESIGTRPVPTTWLARARRECDAIVRLLDEGVPEWLRLTRPPEPWGAALRKACAVAKPAMYDFRQWLDREVPVASSRTTMAGADALERRLRLAHWESRPADRLLAEARRELAEATARWHAMASEASPAGWSGVLDALRADAPTRDTYLPRLQRRWNADRLFAQEHALVTWPEDFPVQFAETDRWARAASADLYYLNYRCPPPYRRRAVHRHQVTFLPDDDTSASAVLQTMHRATISLNHVIHHAGLGHHVQNWHAARHGTPIGQMAAVDGATRIALPLGGTLAEGWACYAVDLVDEFGGLDALERVVQQHTRVRLLCRAVADLALHTGEWTKADVTAHFEREAAMSPDAAFGETVRTALFPGAAVMYWLGTSGLHTLRAREASRFPSLRAFHDALLSFGALPVPMIAQLLSAGSAPERRP